MLFSQMKSSKLKPKTEVMTKNAIYFVVDVRNNPTEIVSTQKKTGDEVEESC